MRILASFALALSLAVSGCGEPSPADILQLTSMDPRRVEVGDRITLTGQNFPAASDVRRIRVTFRGTLARPARTPCSAPTDVTVSDPPPDATVLDATTGRLREPTYAESASRTIHLESAHELSLLVTPALLAQLSRCPGARANGDEMDVAHATLSMGVGAGRAAVGGVIVQIDGLTGGRPIAGTLRGAVLDLEAPPARRLALESALQESATHTLDFLGITLANSHPDEGGLRVATVRLGSPADLAGIGSNDVLERWDGLTIRSVVDVVPASGARTAAITVARGDIEDVRVLSLDGWAPRAPIDLVAAMILLAVLASTVLAFLSPKPALVGWLQRRLAPAQRRMSARRGFAFVGWLASRVRVRPGGSAPSASDSPALRLVPHLAALAVGSTIAATLFGDTLARLPLDAVSLFAFAFVLRTAGRWALRAGGAASVGESVRSIAGTVVLTLPAVLGLAMGIWAGGSTQLSAWVFAQGGAPWEWTVFRTPMGLGLFALYVLPLIDAGGARLTEMHEQRRWRTVGAALEWGGAVLAAWIGAALFLGGWTLPGVAIAEQQASALDGMLGGALFFAKTWAVVGLLVWVRWRVPRLDAAALMVRAVLSLAVLVVILAGAQLAWVAVAPRIPTIGVWAVGMATFLSVVLAGSAAGVVRWTGAIRGRTSVR